MATAALIEPRVARARALTAGAVVAALVAVACALAWRSGSPLVPRGGGLADQGGAPVFLGLLVAAFVAYLTGLALLRALPARLVAVAVVAAAVQLLPLGAPLLLSTDAWTYWDYGRIAAVHGANPYSVAPSAFPRDPAYGAMGANWHDRTSVYGPGFTLASEPLALAAGGSRSAAAWIYKTLAALAVLAAAGIAAAVARRRDLALAFVGWNPVLAVHLAGGGHNDAWVGALVLAGVALAASGRRQASSVAWTLAVAVKWVPIVLFAAHAFARRRSPARPGLAAAVATALGIAGLASWRYGAHWLTALGPLADNAHLETRYALPHRLQDAGLPRAAALALAFAVLLGGMRFALGQDDRPRLAFVACLLLVTSPYLAVWYLGWAVPLAAADEDDRVARVLALALCAYLLPQTIPL